MWYKKEWYGGSDGTQCLWKVRGVSWRGIYISGEVEDEKNVDVYELWNY